MKFLALFLRDLRRLVKGQQKETVQKRHKKSQRGKIKRKVKVEYFSVVL